MTETQHILSPIASAYRPSGEGVRSINRLMTVRGCKMRMKLTDVHDFSDPSGEWLISASRIFLCNNGLTAGFEVGSELLVVIVRYL